MNIHSRKSAARLRARQYVLDELRCAQAEGRETLPGIRQMAAGAGVAHLTMWRAVRDLAAEGRLRTIGHRRIVPAGTADGPPGAGRTLPDSRPHPTPAPTRWRVIADHIEKQIVSGILAPGQPLPSAKELRHRHGSSHATIRQALLSLASAGRIEPFGRGYRVFAPQRPTSCLTVVFVGASARMDMLTDLSPRARELWRALESRCVRLGLRLVIRPVEDFLVGNSLCSTADETVAGYIVRNLDMDTDDAERLLLRIAARGRPVAVVDEIGAGGALVRAADRPGLRTFSIAHSAQAGRLLGEHLTALGHHRIAFLSPYENVAWSRNRLDGLRAALNAQHLSPSVTSHIPPGIADDFALREYASRLPAFGSFLRAVREFDHATEAPLSTHDSFARDPAFAYVLRRVLARHMRPAFESALATEATAWVGVDDATALAAVAFLRRYEIPVPGAVSVAGFDDTYEAAVEGLTSVNFNVTALADALVGHLLGPVRLRARRPPSAVEIPPYVAARGSTARAPNAGSVRVPRHQRNAPGKWSGDGDDRDGNHRPAHLDMHDS